MIPENGVITVMTVTGNSISGTVQYDVGTEDGPDRIEITTGVAAHIIYSDGCGELVPWHMVQHIAYEIPAPE